MNKKYLALLFAAAIAFAGAGCMHKNADPQPVTESSASVQDEPSASVTIEEKVTTRAHDYTRETIIVTDEAGSSHRVVVTQPRVTQYTTLRPSPSRLTSRPTAAPTTRAPRPSTTARPERTTASRPATTKAPSVSNRVTTKAPPTTSASFNAPGVEYGGTLSYNGSSVRITSHTASLSQNNSIVLMLDIDVVSVHEGAEAMYIGYDCYDASGKKLNDEPVRCFISLSAGIGKTKAIATAPISTAKVVFTSI